MEIRTRDNLSKDKKSKRSGQKQLSTSEIYQNALRSFRKGKPAEVLAILKDIVESDTDHIPALKLTAFSLIETGHLDEAKRHFIRLLQFNRNDPETLNALAYLELSEGDAAKGINYLLDAVYVDDENERLKKNLEMLKGVRDAKLAFSLIKPKDFLFIELPQPNASEIMREKLSAIFGSPFARISVIVSVLVILGVLFYLFYPSITNWAMDYRYRRGFGPRYDRIAIAEIDKLVEDRQRYSIRISEEEVNRDMHLIRQHIENNQRNRALVLINKILHSDADERIKERVRNLQLFVPEPDPQNPGFVPNYRDVVRAPFLYEGVYVRWNGTVANLEHRGRDQTSFDLLINFVDEAVVEGIAQAYFSGFIHIINGEKVSLFGTITGITLDNRVIIKGSRIARIGG